MMKRNIFFIVSALLLNLETIAQRDSLGTPFPTASQLSWSKSELGVLISYDLPVFQGKPYNQKQNRIEPIPNTIHLIRSN
jgi:hypothetical protein